MKCEKLAKNKWRIYLQRGYGFSSGNMLEALSGQAVQESWIEVERKHHDFFVVDDSMTAKNSNPVTDNTELGFSSWDEEVVSLDNYSEESECFGMSTKLKWNEVILEPNRFHAPNIERLCEALEHASICAWCPGDI